MRYNKFTLIATTLTLAVLTFTLHISTHAQSRVGYQITDLGTLGGMTSYGAAINASGRITGDARTAAGERHAYVYFRGVMKDIGTLGGNRSTGLGINDSRQVVGFSRLFANSRVGHAFLFSDGRLTDLGTLGGPQSVAQSINNEGEIVGGADL